MAAKNFVITTDTNFITIKEGIESKTFPKNTLGMQQNDADDLLYITDLNDRGKILYILNVGFDTITLNAAPHTERAALVAALNAVFFLNNSGAGDPLGGDGPSWIVLDADFSVTNENVLFATVGNLTINVPENSILSFEANIIHNFDADPDGIIGIFSDPNNSDFVFFNDLDSTNAVGNAALQQNFIPGAGQIRGAFIKGTGFTGATATDVNVQIRQSTAHPDPIIVLKGSWISYKIIPLP